MYCDGSSFSGNLENAVVFNNTNLFFRGIRVLNANFADLLQNRGLSNANQVILTGCSAGGLSTYLHLDYVRTLIPQHIPLHGLADAGWFLDAPSVSNVPFYRQSMQWGFQAWNSTNGVNQACIDDNQGQEWKCIFAPYTYPYIQTPLFVVQAKYDSWQLSVELDIGCLAWDNPPPGHCNSTQIQQFMLWGDLQLKSVMGVINSSKDGIFMDACFQHCQTLFGGSTLIPWFNIAVDNTLIRDAFATWYNNSLVKNHTNIQNSWVDYCEWPCNNCNVSASSSSGFSWSEKQQ